MALCDVKEKRCCFEPAVYQKKEVSFAQQSASLLLSLAALTEHRRNKRPADTTVRSAKEETTTDLHFYPSKTGQSVPGTQGEAHSGCLVGIR